MSHEKLDSSVSLDVTAIIKNKNLKVVTRYGT